jgi:hypothetical protein
MRQRLPRLTVPAVAVFAMLSLAGVRAAAQTFEALGTRAKGLGGAFVAVADDATAVYWNPAGLARGPFLSVVVDYGELTRGADEDGRVSGEPAFRDGSTVIALATLPVGLSYYRLESYAVDSAGVDGGNPISALVTDYVGVTLVQSVGSILDVGATLKYVHGSAGHGVAVPGEDPIDQAELLIREGSNTFDVDIGALAVFDRTRLGVVARNLFSPGFDAPDGTPLEVPVQVRVGVAYVPSDRLTLALDGDLTRTPTATGDRRDIAAGAESWWAARRVGIRGGLRVNTAGVARPVGSVGGSVGVFRGFWVDAGFTAGASESDRAWSVAGRVGF